MAPPSRRKQKSPPSSSSSSATSSSPISLPGVALGLFVAIAAGFAASRALRKKRSVSLKEQAFSAGNDSSIPLLVQDREIETKEKDESITSPLAVSNGTIAISHEPAKLGLKTVFEASIQKNNGAKVSEEEEEDKRAEADEERELREGEGEAMEVKASAVVNEASMEALIKEEDDDEERLEPSPILINGKDLDFNEEMADSEEDLSSGSNSLSDTFSESSLQEVSSAPVKPLPAEEAQINWPETKPVFVAGEEEEVLEGKNWPEMEKNLPEFKQNWPDLKQHLPDLPVSVEEDGELLDLKPVLVEIKEEGASAEKLNHEVISGLKDVKGDYVALKDEVYVDAGLDERSDEAVLSDAPQLDELSTSKAMANGEPSLQLTQEGTDNTGFSTNGVPNLQSRQEGSDHNTSLSTNGEPNPQLELERTDEYKGFSGDPLEKPVLQSHGQNLDSVHDTIVHNAGNNLDAEKEQPSSPIASKPYEKELSSGTKGDDGPAEPIRTERIHVQQQEIEELTGSLHISDQIFESKKLASFTNTTLVYNHNTREADQLIPSVITQKAGLQSKGISTVGGFQRKFHKFAPYLPLEMGLICLLIGLVSFVLWYLGTSSSGQE